MAKHTFLISGCAKSNLAVVCKQDHIRVTRASDKAVTTVQVEPAMHKKIEPALISVFFIISTSPK